MHKLTRPSAPACLSKYHHPQHAWSNVTATDKTAIWQELNNMQQFRCAYCERPIQPANAHIEHFRPRNRQPSFPQGTFAWDNLFGSCNYEESCGKHKDKQDYAYEDLIKMDVDDPEHFLQFLPDGRVVPKANLNATNLQRANETIRVFNLNGVLRQIRFAQLKGYLQTVEEFVEMANEFDESDWLPLLEKELHTIEQLPFATAIKHLFNLIT